MHVMYMIVCLILVHCHVHIRRTLSHACTLTAELRRFYIACEILLFSYKNMIVVHSHAKEHVRELSYQHDCAHVPVHQT